MNLANDVYFKAFVRSYKRDVISWLTKLEEFAYNFNPIHFHDLFPNQ
jgi:hypothetical protein